MRVKPCILGTICTPWNEDFTFAEDVFRASTRHSIESGIDNLYVFGTAGEGHAVTDAQFKRIAGVFLEEMKASSGLCQVGVIGLSTPQIRERIDIGLELGYTQFQFSFPSWGRLNDREMYGFFDEILGTYPESFFLHYNSIRGLRKVTGREYGRIAADHPNLVATKIAADTLAGIMSLFTHAPDVCHFLCEMEYAHAGLFGPAGFLISRACVNPPKAHEFFRAVQDKDLPTVTLRSRELARFGQILHEEVRLGQHMDGAYDKVYSKLLNPDFPLRLLPPYQSTSAEEWEVFIKRLAEELPEWYPLQ